jgi:hypothetical protein
MQSNIMLVELSWLVDKNLLFRVRSMKNEACGTAQMPQQYMGFSDQTLLKHYWAVGGEAQPCPKANDPSIDVFPKYDRSSTPTADDPPTATKLR